MTLLFFDDKLITCPLSSHLLQFFTQSNILVNTYCCSAAKSLQSCPTLCDPTDVSPPGFPAPGILQARTQEWVAISFSNVWKWKSESEVTQSCPTLSDPMDCSLPGSSIHGIFQARVLEWGTISEVIDTSPGNLDFKLCFIQPGISHDVLCIEVK